MNWNDDFATRQYYLNAADEVFDQVFPWEAERPIGLLKKKAHASLTIAARIPKILRVLTLSVSHVQTLQAARPMRRIQH